jgi:hypothetical protein
MVSEDSGSTELRNWPHACCTRSINKTPTPDWLIFQFRMVRVTPIKKGHDSARSFFPADAFVAFKHIFLLLPQRLLGAMFQCLFQYPILADVVKGI